jgi:anthranilate synthase component 1
MKQFAVPRAFALTPSILNGAAFGYISYDCVRYFESKVDAYPQNDTLQIPESMFLFTNSFAEFCHRTKTARLVVLCPIDEALDTNYAAAVYRLQELSQRLQRPTAVDFLNTSKPRCAINKRQRLLNLLTSYLSTGAVYNAGEAGYKQMVRKLKERIVDGDIIQAVPSHRVSRATGAHPFNIFQQLRTLNPSRYVFYIELSDFSIVGSSPELLARIQNGTVENHPIAGTRHRGKTPEEDKALEAELLADEKEKAEHIMLVRPVASNDS